MTDHLDGLSRLGTYPSFATGGIDVVPRTLFQRMVPIVFSMVIQVERTQSVCSIGIQVGRAQSVEGAAGGLPSGIRNTAP